MLNIKLDNPSMEQYIQTLGKEKLEQMFLSFLEVKTQLDEATKSYQTIFHQHLQPIEVNINPILHKKFLALNISTKKTKMSVIRDEIHNRIHQNYNNQSIQNIRDEYYQSKGYL